MIAFVVGAIAMVAGLILNSFTLQYASIMAWILWVGCGGGKMEVI